MPGEVPTSSKGNGEDFQDCTACRLMGGATFLGLGAYCFTVKEEMNLPTPTTRLGAQLARFRNRIPRALGIAFIGVGLYRLAR